MQSEEKREENRYFEDIKKLIESREKKIDIYTKIPFIEYLIDNRGIFFSGLLIFVLITIGGIIFTVSKEYRMTLKILLLISFAINFLVSFNVAYFRRDYHPIFRLGCIASSLFSLYLTFVLIYNY